MTTTHTAITPKRAVKIWQNEVSGTWVIDTQPINARTGKPWQATRRVTQFPIEQKAKAFKRWLEEVNFWRAAARGEG